MQNVSAVSLYPIILAAGVVQDWGHRGELMTGGIILIELF
jgi:hypothetical protein